MAVEMRRAAVCDVCRHAWLLVVPSDNTVDGIYTWRVGGALPRRCAKCKSMKWNATGAANPVVDDGKVDLELEMSEGDRRQIEFLAKLAGKSLTDFIMSKALDPGPVEKVSKPDVRKAPSPAGPPAVEPPKPKGVAAPWLGSSVTLRQFKDKYGRDPESVAEWTRFSKYGA